ncbi:MAG: hypothetical protein OEM18_07020 [Nitrosopumilus sp.]|nr:hypothetical protein [Nitrosopumilus sp.]
MALASVLILGLTTMDNKVYAPTEELFGNYHFFVATCQTSTDTIDPCGKLSGMFRLSVDSFDEGAISGEGKTAIQLQLTPSEYLDQAKKITLRSTALEYTYDTVGNILQMRGLMQDHQGNFYEYDAIGRILDSKNNKSTFEMDIKLESDKVRITSSVEGKLQFAPLQPAEF